MAKREFAPGLPDPRRFGRVTSLPVGSPLRFVIQKHLAERAGPHFDIRMGPDRGRKPTMMSWAARKLPERPGQKTLAFQQPLHTGAYTDFEGKIVSGYGKGTVETHDKGAVLVTKVTPDKINFVVIHKKHPETFTLVRKSGPPASPKTSREAKTQGGTWLMINTTPTDVIKHNKVHYAKVPAEDVAKLFDDKYLHQEKIDGAAALYKLFSDKIEILSYRPTTTGRPIVHSYRVGGTTGLNIPKHLVGSILRGELYGVRRSTGKAIPPQELGGVLNAATLRSLEKQKAQDIELRSYLFNVLRYGKKPIGMELPYPERIEKLREIMQYLPAGKFGLPEMAGTPEEQRELWKRITTGEHPLTREGVVAWPKAGGKPTKVKLYDEADVFVREIFPGKGKLEGTGAGGFKYSLEPEGQIVGEVGTGFSEATRKQMWETPKEYVGRVARIKAQEQFPSGAYRAPAFIGLHEDYPAAKAAALVKRAQYPGFAAPQQFDPGLYQQYQGLAAAPRSVGGALGELGSSFGWTAGPGAAAAAAKQLIARKGLGAAGSAITSRLGPQAAKQFFLGGAAPGVGTVGRVLGGFLPIQLGMEAVSKGIGAFTDPEYQAGRIGLLRSFGRQYWRGADAQDIANQEAMRQGLLSGTLSSAFRGISSPVSTGIGLVRALGRLVASPFTSKSGAQVLAPIIKQAVSELGGEGDTLSDLVKAADDYANAQPPKLSPELAKELGVKPKVPFGDRLRALVTGFKPGEIQSMRSGAKTLSSIMDRIQSLGLVSSAS